MSSERAPASGGSVSSASRQKRKFSTSIPASSPTRTPIPSTETPRSRANTSSARRQTSSARLSSCMDGGPPQAPVARHLEAVHHEIHQLAEPRRDRGAQSLPELDRSGLDAEGHQVLGKGAAELGECQHLAEIDLMGRQLEREVAGERGTL